MTRNVIRRTHTLRVIAQLFGVLAVLISLVALAQTRGAGSPFAEFNLFKLFVVYDSGGQLASSLAVGDVNGDGKPDLLVTNTDRVGVLLGHGDGTFQTAVAYPSGGDRCHSVAVADVNGDNKLDLIVANDGAVGVLLGNGNGTFQPVVTYGPGGQDAVSVAVMDVNGDGKPDILVANECAFGTNCADGALGVLLGNGDGTFQPAVAYFSGGKQALSVAVSDVNGDGKPDLLVANGGSSTVGVLLGNGNGTFQAAAVYGSGGACTPVVVADVNDDDWKDLVMSCAVPLNAVSVLLGNGDGTFRTAVIYGSGGQNPLAVAVGDVNGDGRPDLAVANEFVSHSNDKHGTVGVLLGNGDGTFQTAATYSSGGVASFVAVGDVNGDGKPDLLAANFCVSGTNCANGTVGVLLRQSAATTTQVTTSGSPSLVNQPVTFTATVTSKFGNIPNGELVTFYDGATTIGTGATASGVATFTTSSLSAKTHTIKAKYPGDAIFKPSSGSVLQVVEKYSTTTTLTSSPNPSQFGQAVTFTAHVSGTGPAPTGRVKFLDGAIGIGSATLNGSGVAKLTKSTLAVGTHPITAQYLGDAVSAKSTSSVVNQVVQ